jgi:hypothetical protein
MPRGPPAERLMTVNIYRARRRGGLYSFIAPRRGELARAETLCQRALAINEDVLGHGHPELATTLNNLGLLRQDRGGRTGALALFTRAATTSSPRPAGRRSPASPGTGPS